MSLTWTIKDNNPFAKYICKHPSVSAPKKSYPENTKQIHKKTPTSNCYPDKVAYQLYLNHTSARKLYHKLPHSPTTLSHKKTHVELFLKRESYLWKKYNTKLTKYCAIYLNARFRLLKIKEMTQTFLVKIFLVIYNICICQGSTYFSEVLPWKFILS